MRLEFPSSVVAMATVTGATGVAVTAAGCTTARTAKGTYTITLPDGGLAAADNMVLVTARGATTSEWAVAQTSATVKTIVAISNAGAAQDVDFDVVVLAFPGV